MDDLWNPLLECLDLRPPESDTGTMNLPPGLFDGVHLPLTYRRLFGGQILGQFVRAAELACPDKTVKSIHTLFAKEGRYDEPLRYEVARLHEGRSFASLAITATQSGRLVAGASVSMHIEEEGPQHQRVDGIADLPGPEHRVRFDLLPWETRAVDDLDATTAEPPEYEFWMRTPEVGVELAAALTAYATDLTLIGTALRPFEGVNQRGNGTVFTSAVTAHTLWFHRPFRTDDWLLLRQHSPLLARGRCFGRGDVLTAAGELVASFAQEALLRFDSAAAQQFSPESAAQSV
ncbi:acyl-CoA thioesterase II [Nocardia sp. GTS18]|uniref:acyl-CoA thioesterase n=1 Tax=Nocardia sp. GTS18 TaxID=1778064 RepID=UPI0015EF1400|nr:acyl-CoA thioesterase domain-containing protein [Nocardia sp. GTS18]